MEVTPARDVWPWLVRHAGWLLWRYHVNGNKKKAFEDCFGKPYQGEVMNFAEAALFRVAVSPSGRTRGGIREGRAEARFVRGIWLGKTTESDDHLFATDSGVYTTRTVKRVPDTEQRRADLVKSLQGNAEEQACKTASGKTSQDRDSASGPSCPSLSLCSRQGEWTELSIWADGYRPWGRSSSP